MKFSVFAISIFLVIGFLTPVQAGDPGFELSVGGYSSYIWRGFRLSEEELQIQPSATVSMGGFSANIWAEYDSDTEEWLELDYTASYGHAFDMINLELGYIHYDINEGLDSDEIYFSAGFNSFLNPSVTVYVDVNEGEGAFIVAGISHPVELSEMISLEFGAAASMIVDNGYVATDANGDEFTGLFNADLTASASIALCDFCSVDPMAGYTVAISDDASDAIEMSNSDGDDAFFYGGLALTLSF